MLVNVLRYIYVSCALWIYMNSYFPFFTVILQILFRVSGVKCFIRVDPLAARASVTRAYKACSCVECVHMRLSGDNRWSLLVGSRSTCGILHCGRNNGKKRLGSFSWSQRPRQVHCRHFPPLLMHSSDVSLNQHLIFVRSFYVHVAFKTGTPIFTRYSWLVAYLTSFMAKNLRCWRNS